MLETLLPELTVEIVLQGRNISLKPALEELKQRFYCEIS